MRSKIFYFFFLLTYLTSCSYAPYYSKEVRQWKSISPPDSADLNYTVYLIGDAGDASLQNQGPTLKLLQSFIEKDSNSVLLFLGDNIYHNGLPGSSGSARSEAEEKVNEQMEIAKNYKGEIYFISGNHDWDYMGPEGIDRIKNQERYIEEYLNRGNTFIPDRGCPGPYYVKLSNNVVLLAIDSQWSLHKYSKPYGRCGDCNAEDEDDFLVQLEDFIQNNRNRHIVAVAHHPLYSNGNHGGYYNILDHIFPLRLTKNNWYVPLPVIGSLYPLYRKFGGVDQDIPHYRYQVYKNKITAVLGKYDNTVYAACHDHNLQYHPTDSLYHIVSGSGFKMNPVKGGREGKLSFRTLMYTRKSGALESYCSPSATDYSDSSVVARPTAKYQAGSLRNMFFGHHYRKEWSTPVKVPVLDLKTEKGGLIPYGIGGGKQSVSLKLRNVDDKEYILRSINKDPTKAIPLNFRQTFLHDIVDDQISAQHPYGALAVPALPDAVNVYHTNPRVVLIPNDSCLGPYREQFKNMLALFEEDPDENHEDVASLGNSENIVGTDRMRELIESDNDIRLDERNFLRARLLDMLIGDWDRHERQYRWASMKTGDKEFFRPVPEDRDQVFFKFDGIFPYIASRKWALRNLQNFEAGMGDIKGLNTTPRVIDRRYLSSLSLKDWKEISDSMRTALTDEVITKAVGEFPAEVYSLHGPEIISKLKSRRDQLPEAAEEYYLLLSKYVNVFGTDKHERFEVERINNQQTKVTVYKIKKDGEIKSKLYERTFLRKETKEIRLYGLGGEDVFELKGNVKRGVKIRLLGGDGKDEYTEQSRVGGIIKKSIVYDTKEDNKFVLSRETNQELSKKETIHYPSLDNFNYNYLGPQFTLDFNPDDGLFFGGGFLYRKYKFRQNPYGAMHKLLASIATSTGSVRIDYKGEVKSAVSSFDLGLNFEMYTPAYAMNFFGYGNESIRKDTSIEYYRVRLQQAVFNPSLNKTFTRYLTVGLGPKYQYFKLERKASTFLGENSSEASDIYSSRQYAGLRGFFRLGTRDNERNPTRGILLTGEANFNQRIDDGGFYSQYLSDFSFYITPNIPFQLTFAGRVGGAMNFGDYEFYQANSLGSVTGLGFSGGNLRGFRRTRFVGDHSFYQNAEVRAQLFRFNTYIFPGKFGVLGFFDNGRVWAENENSSRWHMGYGGGIWMDIFHHFIASAMYGFSEDDQVATFRLGFFF